MIGESDDPNRLMLTDYDGPLMWSLFGTFKATNIERGTVTCEIGTTVSNLEINWRPASGTPTQSLQTATPYQKAQAGLYDNMRVRVWTCYMPTPGDADTYGCCERFGGRVGKTNVVRGQIKFNCTDFLDVLNQNVPAQVIEVTNSQVSGVGATPPSGLASIPRFNVIAGSTERVLILDCISPSAHQIFGEDALHNGFLIFQSTGTSTVGGLWSAILGNKELVINPGDHHYNEITLCSPLPFAPSPGVDTCLVSGAAPINQADGNFNGFPFVPTPEGAL
jgi:hypothetical protein